MKWFMNDYLHMTTLRMKMLTQLLGLQQSIMYMGKFGLT